MHNDSIFREYLEVVVPSTEAPLRYHCAAAMAALGAVIGRRAMLRVGTHRLYTITPTILVGPSGIGKGEALGVARAVLKRIKSEQVARHEGSDFMVWEPAMWILEDEATPQALVRAFTVKPNGAMMEDHDPAEVAIVAGEMATFMGRSGEKEGMVPVLTKLLEQDDSYTRTLVKDMKSGDNQTIIDPTLSFLAGTTVEWMRKLMPNEMFTGGFFRRCVMVREERKGHHLDWPVALGDKAINRMCNIWKRKLFREGPFPKEVHNKSGENLTVAFDFTQSFDYWAKWKRRHAANRPSDSRLVGHYHSLPQHIMRTAMCFAAARGRLDVTPSDLREGEAYIESLLDDVHQILLQGEVHGFSDMAQLLERIMLDKCRTNYRTLKMHIRCPQKQFDELIHWALSVGMIKKSKARKDQGETGTWVELSNRRRTPWGKVRRSND